MNIFSLCLPIDMSERPSCKVCSITRWPWIRHKLLSFYNVTRTQQFQWAWGDMSVSFFTFHIMGESLTHSYYYAAILHNCVIINVQLLLKHNRIALNVSAQSFTNTCKNTALPILFCVLIMFFTSFVLYIQLIWACRFVLWLRIRVL